MTISNILAAGVQAPFTLAVNRLAATALGALSSILFKRTRIATIHRRLAYDIFTATLVLVVSLIVMALSVF